jgi:hypothetical protein
MQRRTLNPMGTLPACHVDKNHKIHRHVTYERNGNCNDKNPLILIIMRFLCVICGHTISLLPDDYLPYRAVPVRLVETHFDAKANGTAEPAATEKEKGCLKRAWTRFKQRVSSLTARLGQMIRPVKPTAAQLWNQLRRKSNLTAILLQLVRPFNSSLLGDYLCLRPWRRDGG